VQAQTRSLTEQASEWGQAVSRAAMDAAKPKNGSRKMESRKTKGLNLKARKSENRGYFARTGPEMPVLASKTTTFVPRQRSPAGKIRPSFGRQCGIAH
jgi:hypothetical protein